jgi:hypothetical protein
VHLIFNTLHDQAPVLAWQDLADAMGTELLASRAVLLQYGQKAGLLHDGQQLASWAVQQDGGPAKLTAQLRLASPCVIVAGQPVQLLVTGTDLCGPGVKLHARCQGRYLQVSAAPAVLEEQGQQQEVAGSGHSCVALELPAVPCPGLIWLEAEQHKLISEAVPLLVVPDAATAAELLCLSGMTEVRV